MTVERHQGMNIDILSLPYYEPATSWAVILIKLRDDNLVVQWMAILKTKRIGIHVASLARKRTIKLSDALPNDISDHYPMA